MYSCFFPVFGTGGAIVGTLVTDGIGVGIVALTLVGTTVAAAVKTRAITMEHSFICSSYSFRFLSIRRAPSPMQVVPGYLGIFGQCQKFPFLILLLLDMTGQGLFERWAASVHRSII